MIGQSFFSEGDLKIFTNLIWEWDEQHWGWQNWMIVLFRNWKKNPPELNIIQIIFAFLLVAIQIWIDSDMTGTVGLLK